MNRQSASSSCPPSPEWKQAGLEPVYPDQSYAQPAWNDLSPATESSSTVLLISALQSPLEPARQSEDPFCAKEVVVSPLNEEDSPKYLHDASELDKRKSRRGCGRRFWLLVIVVLVIIIALVVGLDLGLGLTKKHKQK
jgi:hypothetical protein